VEWRSQQNAEKIRHVYCISSLQYIHIVIMLPVFTGGKDTTMLLGKIELGLLI